jgi:hypothetical protein
LLPCVQCFRVPRCNGLALLACMGYAQWQCLPPRNLTSATAPSSPHSNSTTTAGGRRAVPEETFVAIETLLPMGKGSFLELWAPRGVRRPGWTHVVEVPEAAAEAAES